MILLADSGSTKTSWCLKSINNTDFHFATEGYNPYYLDSSYIANSIKAGLPNEIKPELITEVNFYGAGCSEDKGFIIKDALKDTFKNAVSYVDIDLLAAARSVLGNTAGFVGILGTGTNSCLYNGKKITHIVNSLGFLMGDEGSGGYLGKKLLTAYSRAYLPESLVLDFFENYHLTANDIVNEVYATKMPNTYCASFCPFISKHITHPFIDEMVKSSFRDFFTNIVNYYPNYKDETFNCVGSIAHNFLPQLNAVANEFEMKIGNIIRNPMDGLIEYHRV
ncbi:N-acetylglucosamine kinase [Pedobacter alpinus]|uniref:N-acetylglucosamine kinase n=1 Tax=Pedobacter alpinus TaxID=1590643 RepID=A0ABW5TTP5_9SPHI